MNKRTIIAYHIGIIRGSTIKNYTYLGIMKIGETPEFNNLFYREKEKVYTDESGNILLTKKEVNSGIGRIEVDGYYDTTYTVRVKDLTDKELTAIYKANKEDYKLVLLTNKFTKLEIKIAEAFNVLDQLLVKIPKGGILEAFEKSAEPVYNGDKLISVLINGVHYYDPEAFI